MQSKVKETCRTTQEQFYVESLSNQLEWVWTIRHVAKTQIESNAFEAESSDFHAMGFSQLIEMLRRMLLLLSLLLLHSIRHFTGENKVPKIGIPKSSQVWLIRRQMSVAVKDSMSQLSALPPGA